jgi:translation initiation factor 1
MSDDLVYSTNQEINRTCQKCKKNSTICTCKKNNTILDFSKIKAHLRLEKAHRGGKDVTVVDKLPASEDFLKALAQNVKKQCGTGGTWKINENIGLIEIQGDKRELVKKILLKLGIQCK